MRDGVVREVYSRTHGRRVKLRNESGSEWVLSQLLFADDTALVADSAEPLQALVREFGRVCERRKLRVNVDKSKVMVAGRDVGPLSLNLQLNGDSLEEIQSFKYLGSCFSSDNGVGEGMRTFGAMKRLWNVRSVNVRAKKELYESVVVPTVMYGSEAWGLRVEERRKLDVMEMRCL